MCIRFLILATVALSLPAAAQDEAKYSELASSVFQHMANTYMCRNALGGIAHYQAARTIATETMAPHVGRDKAVLAIDEMDQKFKADPRTKNPKVDSAGCLAVVNDGLHRIEVAKAKLGTK